jgi:hypothetical protein
VDITPESLATFAACGVVGVAVGDVVELCVFVSRAKVVQRVVPIVNGVESAFELTLSDAARLVAQVPDLLTVPLRSVRFEEAAAADILAALDESASPPAASRPASPAAEAPADAEERPVPATAPGKPRAKRAEPRRSPAAVTVRSGAVMAANDLAEALEAAGLAGYAPVLAKARIMSLAELSEHSVAELEESFRRPHVIAKAKDFSFSSKERRGWISLGRLDDGSGSDEEVWRARAPSPSPEPPRPVMSGMVRSVVRSAFGQALPEADLSRLGDLLDESAVDHAAPRATPPRQPLTRPPTGLFEGATAAAILLGRCEPADLSTDAVRSVLRIVLGAVAKEYDDVDLGSMEEAAVSRESAIDVLDSVLVRGCRANLWAAEELEPTRDGVLA